MFKMAGNVVGSFFNSTLFSRPIVSKIFTKILYLKFLTMPNFKDAKTLPKTALNFLSVHNLHKILKEVSYSIKTENHGLIPPRWINLVVLRWLKKNPFH